MIRNRTWYVDMSAAFPPDRPISGLMARLMVLWADAVLEYDAIGSEEEGKGSAYEHFDRLDPIYRRLYFWRSLAITLASAESLLKAFASDPEFREWTAADPEQREQFNDARNAFLRNLKAVTTVRNWIGAHMDTQVGEAPNTTASGAEEVREQAPEG